MSHLSKCRVALTFTIKMALHLRWLNTEKFQNYEIVKGGCIPNENKFKTQINTNLRWFASGINFKLLHVRCPIAHVPLSFLIRFFSLKNMQFLVYSLYSMSDAATSYGYRWTMHPHGTMEAETEIQTYPPKRATPLIRFITVSQSSTTDALFLAISASRMSSCKLDSDVDIWEFNSTPE